MTEMRLDHLSVQKLVEHSLAQASRVIVGKTERIRLAFCCLLAGGHLLIEDLPGVGKTTLSQVLARLLGLEFNRIQFTSDLLPADITGASIYNKESGEFVFQPGPVFTQVLLADEINRATPKAQSALLEAMEEGQVTVDGQTWKLPSPFFVIATQNPSHHIGTFPLPESQLDRFMMCIDLGYPSNQAEREILKGRDRREILKELSPVLSRDQLRAVQAAIKQVHAADAVIEYLQALVDHTRHHMEFGHGISTRGALAMINAARAWAYLDGRRRRRY